MSGDGGHPDQDGEFEALLEYIQRNRGFDFTGYKKSTVLRRIQRRMGLNRMDDLGRYAKFLRQNAIDANTGLSGITVFRRDRALDGSIDVRVVEDDKRRVSAELH